jgi:hypothetical protein
MGREVGITSRKGQPSRQRRPPKARPGPGSDRQAEALALRQEGLTFAQIGERLGVSRQRAAQLVQAAEGESVWKPPVESPQ